MAKNGKKNKSVLEWAFFIVLVLILLTNIVWYFALRSVNDRLDQQALDIKNLQAQIVK